jgi:signal peptidase II
VSEGTAVHDPTARSWTGGGKAALFLGIVAGLVALDYVTKQLVLQHMYLYQQIELVGEYLRLTFIRNPGAAFGIQVGPYSRIIFLLLTVVALVVLLAMYWSTPAQDRFRVTALALICGGALGNLVDRVQSAQGVVDFLDLGVGDMRWPIFNVADIGVTAGAVLLALSLWREDQEDARR